MAIPPSPPFNGGIVRTPILSASAGQTSAPAYAFATETNSGLYMSVAGGTIGLVLRGTMYLGMNGATGGPSAINYGLSTSAGAQPDVLLARDAANILALKNSNNDQTQRWYSSNSAYAQIQSLSESHTLAAAATSDTTIQFPANSIALGVTVRVTTLITGCVTFDVGIAGATTRYGTGLALSSGTTNASAGTTNPVTYAAATSVRFSAVGGGASFTAGVIRITLHYISLSAATS